FLHPEAAVEHALEMVSQGADIIDVGGESTRPGAEPVPEPEEAGRVLPVIESLGAMSDVAISIDTTKAAVAEAAIEAGAVIVNDVSAMRFDPAMPAVVARSGSGVVLMHMLGEPRTMQSDPRYADVVFEVSLALGSWADAAERAGIQPQAIALDPGIGFGKTREHNLALLKNLDRLSGTGYPVVVGPSRKSFIGLTLDLPVEERLEGTAAAVAWAVAHGAQVVRVHDVRQMARVVRMTEAIMRAPR
ncbi:MAG: dihydropteroate synthase, partial [Candidatus Methylomirabilales bacterium]